MLRPHPIRSDAEIIDVIKGLLELKRDGHFYALWATDSRIDVQYEPTGPMCTSAGVGLNSWSPRRADPPPWC